MPIHKLPSQARRVHVPITFTYKGEGEYHFVSPVEGPLMMLQDQKGNVTQIYALRPIVDVLADALAETALRGIVAREEAKRQATELLEKLEEFGLEIKERED